MSNDQTIIYIKSRRLDNPDMPTSLLPTDTKQALSQDSSAIISTELHPIDHISPDLLSLSPDLLQQVKDLLNSSRQSNVPPFQDLPDMEEIYVPVSNGEIRVLHYCPPSAESVRPLVFVPGWGVPPSVFSDWFEVLYNRVEFYYIERRKAVECTAGRLNLLCHIRLQIFSGQLRNWDCMNVILFYLAPVGVQQ
ncbi:MAG: hypothetical protein ACTSRK_20765 [Promethearchaeota archaeon]